MKYYKIKEKYDNKMYLIKKNNGTFKHGGFLIGGELYTEKEFNKLKDKATVYNHYAEVIEIPKSKVHTFFGARFENRGE